MKAAKVAGVLAADEDDPASADDPAAHIALLAHVTGVELLLVEQEASAETITAAQSPAERPTFWIRMFLLLDCRVEFTARRST